MAKTSAAVEQASPVPSEFAVFTQISTDSGILAAMKTVSRIVNTKILTVKNDEQELIYTEMLIQSKTIMKQVEGRRKSIVDPLNRAARAVNDWVKRQITTPIEAKEREINNALLAYRIKKAELARQQEEKARKLQEKIQADLEAKGIDMAVPQIVTPGPEKIVRPESGGQVHERGQFYIEWRPEPDAKMCLVKAVAEGKVPVDALDANWSVIRNLAKGGLEIPGISYGYRTALTVRGA